MVGKQVALDEEALSRDKDDLSDETDSMAQLLRRNQDLHKM